MTEGPFAEMMKAVDGAFDAWHPGNISPLVVWLSSNESRSVSGRVFEIQGGRLSLATGWQPGPAVDKGRRWQPTEVGDAVAQLLAEAPQPAPVYGA